VTAIVVSWNCADLLQRCLESLRAHAPDDSTMDIVVVDNGSTDGSVELVRSAWPDVRLLVNAENDGFTRANNQAIRASSGDHLLLVNSDAFVKPGCIDRLLARMEADPRAAVVGPRLVYGDGRWQRWTAGAAPTLGSAFNHYFFLERLLPALCRGIWLGRDTRRPFRPDWVVSACMLVRRAAIDEVGPLDESFGSYVEDLDLCRRVRAAGWTVWYEPTAEAVHLMGQSTKRQTGKSSPAAVRNFNLYFDRLHGRMQGRLLRLIEASGFALRAVAYTVAAPARNRGLEMAKQHWSHARLALSSAAGGAL
jgi:GT2 family glycosyltransferase